MTIKEMRTETGLSQSKFAKKFNIPLTNLQMWEQGIHNPTKYVVSMVSDILRLENEVSELKGELNMKRWIHSSAELRSPEIDLNELNIVSVVFVSDAREYRPGAEYVSASSSNYKIPYRSMTRENLLQLPKRERERITDIEALRKLKYDELTVQQKRIVTLANQDDQHKSSKKEVEGFLDSLSEESSIFIFPIQKNRDFASEIKSLGGDLDKKDVLSIIRSLNYSDYKYSKYSYLEWDWNAELMVFRFNGSYTFSPLKEGGDPVTVDGLEIYIKIDVETITNDSYIALSFHRPGK